MVICSPFTENATPEERKMLILFLMCEAFEGPDDYIELDFETYDMALEITEGILSELDTIDEAFDMIVRDEDDRIRIQTSDEFKKVYAAVLEDVAA